MRCTVPYAEMKSALLHVEGCHRYRVDEHKPLNSLLGAGEMWSKNQGEAQGASPILPESGDRLPRAGDTAAIDFRRQISR